MLEKQPLWVKTNSGEEMPLSAPGEATRKFYCDTMLGRLAKWLRLLGYDADYRPEIDDWEMLKLCRSQGRTLLTRDTRVMKRWQISRGQVLAVLLSSDRVKEQIGELSAAVGLKATGEVRCPICNQTLDPLAREKARDRVPPYVYETQSEFRTCPACGRVYWKATHWREIENVRGRFGVTP